MKTTMTQGHGEAAHCDLSEQSNIFIVVGDAMGSPVTKEPTWVGT